MAITSKKSKTRLDFGEALNDALFYNNPEPEQYKTEIDMPETPIQRVEPTVPIETEREIFSQEANTKVTSHTSRLIADGLDDADMFLAIAKGPRGVQRSIYFESDVYQYLQAKSEKYNVKFSNLVNMLLREAILNHTKSKGN